MTGGSGLLPDRLREEIDEAIITSDSAWSTFVDANRETGPGSLPLAVKYLPSRYAATYKGPNQGLYIGSSDFTWGRGVYVTGVQEPLSTAIYGRAGVVARFDPAGWRTFDARDAANQQLYLQWLHAQVDYPQAVLTVHSNHWLHGFRNFFREQFHIDVVLFPPDEADAADWYTNATDTWMAVSDWDGWQLKIGYSARFSDARLSILIEDEFVPDKPPLTRTPQYMVSSSAPNRMGLTGSVRTAYRNNTTAGNPLTIVRVAS